jgi:ribonuclease E
MVEKNENKVKKSRIFGGRKPKNVPAVDTVPTEVVPAQVVPAETRPSRTTPAKAEATKAEPAKVESVEVAAPKASARKAAPAKSTPVDAPVKAAPARRSATKKVAPPVSAAAAAAAKQGSVDAGPKSGSTSSRSKAAVVSKAQPGSVSPLAPLFQAPDLPPMPDRSTSSSDEEATTVRRRTRRRSGEESETDSSQPNTVVKVRQPRQQPAPSNEPQRVKGSTRLEAKKQRRRDGRDAGRRRPVITEAEFLARRESVDRTMIVRSKDDRIQIGVLEDKVLVEHYVAKAQEASLIGNVYLGRVQNVLPSMEAAFVDIGRGRNAVLYSGEVDWDAAAENSSEGKQQARRIELALKPGDKVLVQVTKDPVGHKGARLTSQVSLPGRYLVYVPNGSMNGISRKLPDTERSRLKKILKEVLPENVGVIVRTAAEGATEEQLTLDVNRLTAQWSEISSAVENSQAPALLHSEPDLLVKIIRDVFNEDFQKLVVSGDDAMATIQGYLSAVAPDLADRVERFDGSTDAFDEYRITEQIEKALDRKVWLPSGGSLVIDRTEAMTVVDVNTGKFVGSGGNLEETVTKNNLEAAEEIVRQLRLRDIGGIIVVDFIDMVLESNRDLVLRRLVECLSRDRTKHQVAEVTSLGLVQMTRKKLGLGLLESFSEACEACAGRGIIVHHDPVTKHRQSPQPEPKRSRGKGGQQQAPKSGNGGTHAITEDVKNALAQIAASTIAPVVELGGQTPPVAAIAESQPVTEQSSPATPPSVAEKATTEVEEHTAEEHTVEILDIPVPKSKRVARSVSAKDAEKLLDSVLDALPDPVNAGAGRTRTSRRASSAGQTVDPTA